MYFSLLPILPIFGVGSVQLFAAEATGPPMIKYIRVLCYSQMDLDYLSRLTIAEIILLIAGRYGFFDSVMSFF